jgi:hypothetical protein
MVDSPFNVDWALLAASNAPSEALVALAARGPMISRPHTPRGGEP